MSGQTDTSALEEDVQATFINEAYRKSRMDFGLARIKMGSYLHLIQENKLWEGRAESWAEFVASENLQPNAVRQYINVAKKFIFDMDLSDDVLAKLSLAGISALESAGKIINEQNKDEIISALTQLAEKDAVQRIIEMSSSSADKKNDSSNMRVLRLLKEFYGMPPDLQMEFKDKIKSTQKKAPN
jgi:hypothetical protein